MTAAAYQELRSSWGRSEAFADLLEQAWTQGRYDAYPGHYPPGYAPDDDDPLPPACLWQLPPPMWLADPRGMFLNLPWRFRHGHPEGLPVLAAFITGICLAAVTLIPHLPHPAVADFGIVWFIVTAREALAPPPGQ